MRPAGAPAPRADHRRSLWERLAPHWLLIVVLALVAAFVLWLASYGIAQ